MKIEIQEMYKKTWATIIPLVALGLSIGCSPNASFSTSIVAQSSFFLEEGNDPFNTNDGPYANSWWNVQTSPGQEYLPNTLFSFDDFISSSPQDALSQGWMVQLESRRFAFVICNFLSQANISGGNAELLPSILISDSIDLNDAFEEFAVIIYTLAVDDNNYGVITGTRRNLRNAQRGGALVDEAGSEDSIFRNHCLIAH